MKKQFSKRPQKKQHTLTKQQQKTVEQNLQKRIETLKAENAIEAIVISHMGYNIVVQIPKCKTLVACDWRQNIGAICAGDKVLIVENGKNSDESSQFRIEAVLPRMNVIEKQNVYRGAKPFAANIDQLLVIITHEPMFQPSLLDRYLVMANVVGIDILIYFNKTDILTNSKTINHINTIEKVYSSIPNTHWARGSIITERGLEELNTKLENRKTVITGQSGVGKSSLINALIPDIDIQTMSISQASGLGRHSTTNSTVYHLDNNTMHDGILIDTPGVRSFDTYHLSEQQIEEGFAEITPYLGSCRFSDCSHTHEDGCSLKQAIKDGKVSQLRYDSFLQMLNECKNYER